MLTILILAVGSLAILVVLLLLIVVIGIRQEPPTELSGQAPSLVAVFVRRLLGVYVRKPDSPPKLHQGDKGHTSLLVGSMDKPNLE